MPKTVQQRTFERAIFSEGAAMVTGSSSAFKEAMANLPVQRMSPDKTTKPTSQAIPCSKTPNLGSTQKG